MNSKWVQINSDEADPARAPTLESLVPEILDILVNQERRRARDPGETDEKGKGAGRGDKGKGKGKGGRGREGGDFPPPPPPPPP